MTYFSELRCPNWKVKYISAAVLVSSIMSVVVGAIVFIPYLIELWADRV